MLTLYQFQFSHYCEKARWALDYKGCIYVVNNLVPGLHRRTARAIAPRTSLPILVDDDIVVQDSDALITYLDRKHAARPLTPADASAASLALNWERDLDRQLGIPLRLWFYQHLLSQHDLALPFLLKGTPSHLRPIFRLMFPRVRAVMRHNMHINAANAEQAEQTLLRTFDRLDRTLDRAPFLAAETFSRADLTAAALLCPLIGPDQSEPDLAESLPGPVCAFRDRHKLRPFWTWALGLYRQYRTVSTPTVQPP